jgi:hypothetical protein
MGKNSPNLVVLIECLFAACFSSKASDGPFGLKRGRIMIENVNAETETKKYEQDLNAGQLITHERVKHPFHELFFDK